MGGTGDDVNIDKHLSRIDGEDSLDHLLMIGQYLDNLFFSGQLTARECLNFVVEHYIIVRAAGSQDKQDNQREDSKDSATRI